MYGGLSVKNPQRFPPGGCGEHTGRTEVTMGVKFEEEIEDEDDLDPKSLRGKLAAAAKRERALTEELHGLKVKDVLTVKGFSLVKPEDLKGVDLDKVEAEAERIEKERQTLQESLLRDALKRRGFEDDELDEMVKGLAGQEAAETEDAKAISRIKGLGTLDSKPVPARNPEKLHGDEAIMAGLAAAEKRRQSRRA